MALNLIVMIAIWVLGMSAASLVFQFIPAYSYMATIASFLAFIGGMITLMMGFMLSPVMPYLEAVMKKSMLMIINLSNNNLIMDVPKKKASTADTRFDGTFIINPHSVRTFMGKVPIDIAKNVVGKSFGGVKTLLVYEENAVPPEIDLVKLCDRLSDANIKSLDEWKTKVQAGETPIEVRDLDIKVVSRYFAYIHPHYLNVRIAKIAAELAREYSQTWQKILPWISMMIVLMLMGVLAFIMLTSVLDDGTTAATTASNIPTIVT